MIDVWDGSVVVLQSGVSSLGWLLGASPLSCRMHMNLPSDLPACERYSSPAADEWHPCDPICAASGSNKVLFRKKRKKKVFKFHVPVEIQWYLAISLTEICLSLYPNTSHLFSSSVYGEGSKVGDLLLLPILPIKPPSVNTQSNINDDPHLLQVH